LYILWKFQVPIYFIHVYIYFLCLNCALYIFVFTLKFGFIYYIYFWKLLNLYILSFNYLSGYLNKNKKSQNIVILKCYVPYILVCIYILTKCCPRYIFVSAIFIYTIQHIIIIIFEIYTGVWNLLILLFYIYIYLAFHIFLHYFIYLQNCYLFIFKIVIYLFYWYFMVFGVSMYVCVNWPTCHSPGFIFYIPFSGFIYKIKFVFLLWTTSPTILFKRYIACNKKKKNPWIFELYNKKIKMFLLNQFSSFIFDPSFGCFVYICTSSTV